MSTLPVIYIAGPYRGPTAWAVEKNIRAAEEMAFRVAVAGGVPLCPHTMFRYFDGELDADKGKFWIDATLELLRRCDGAIFIEGWRKSVGSLGELRECEALVIPRLVGGDGGRLSASEIGGFLECVAGAHAFRNSGATP